MLENPFADSQDLCHDCFSFQICNHPGLIKSMLDAESKSTESIEGVPDEEGRIDDAIDADLLSRMEDMAIGKTAGDHKVCTWLRNQRY